MSLRRPPSWRVARGMATLHMVRLLTCTLGGEASLNFIGNEFGHAEWLDFPCARNGHSLALARRRWDLADDPSLRYGQVLAFDKAMRRAEADGRWLQHPAPRAAVAESAESVAAGGEAGGGGGGEAGGGGGGEAALPGTQWPHVCHHCGALQLVWFRRAASLFVFNFDATRAVAGPLRCSAPPPPPAPSSPPPPGSSSAASSAHRRRALRLRLTTDAEAFGGHGRPAAAVWPAPSDDALLAGASGGGGGSGGGEGHGGGAAGLRGQQMLHVTVPPLTACVFVFE